MMLAVQSEAKGWGEKEGDSAVLHGNREVFKCELSSMKVEDNLSHPHERSPNKLKLIFEFRPRTQSHACVIHKG